MDRLLSSVGDLRWDASLLLPTLAAEALATGCFSLVLPAPAAGESKVFACASFPIEVSEEEVDLGDDDPECKACVSSFKTELKSARTDDDIEEVSVRFEFDCDSTLTSLGFDGGLRAVATFFASSDDTESEPEPDDGLFSLEEEEAS